MQHLMDTCPHMWFPNEKWGDGGVVLLKRRLPVGAPADQGNFPQGKITAMSPRVCRAVRYTARMFGDQ